MNLHKVSWWLLVIGGLNWGLVAFGMGLSDWLPSDLLRLVYILIGAAAVYQLVITHRK